jgi:hypothetical protein
LDFHAIDFRCIDFFLNQKNREMKRLLLLFLLAGLHGAALGQDFPRLTYWRMGLFYQTGHERYASVGGSDSNLGHTAGFEAYVNPAYPGFDDSDPLLVGWSLNGWLGWNFTRSQLSAYGLDIGVWSSYQLTEKLEVGVQYSFLGVYAFESASHLGSAIRPAVRFGRFQCTLARSGSRAVYGWLAPKDTRYLSAQHSAELAWSFSPKFMLAGRILGYRSNGGKVRELRLSAALRM